MFSRYGAAGQRHRALKIERALTSGAKLSEHENFIPASPARTQLPQPVR